MVKKILLKISGMHCSACAMDIDGTLEDTKGVIESNTSYAKSETTVKFDADKLQEVGLMDLIRKVGYEPIVLKYDN